MTSRSSSSRRSITSDRRSRATALRVPRSSRSRLERSAFCIATRWRASTMNKLVLARRLYQALRSIAKIAFPGTVCRLILLSNSRGPILVCDLLIVCKLHYLIPGRLSPRLPLLPRITTSPSVIGRLATILFVYELLHPGCIAPQQSETRSKFWNRWIEYLRIGFPVHSSRACGRLRGVALLLTR